MNLCNSFCSSKKPEVPKILQIYLTNNYLYGKNDLFAIVIIFKLLLSAISSFIDNIASTMIGGIYLETFKGKVHIVYVA